MELQEAWGVADFYLGQIVCHTKDLRQKVEGSIQVSETPGLRTCVLSEIDTAEKEVAEALRLSKSAHQRLQNLHSRQRKGFQDGPAV